MALTKVVDRDGHVTTYGYDPTGTRITQIDDQSTNQHIELVYHATTNNLEQIRVVDTSGTSDIHETRTRYTYDASNRLEQVIVDLTPADNSTADGQTYVTTYSYDGTSNRVASIANGEGVSLAIGYFDYGAAGTEDWRVSTLTDGEDRVTSFGYQDGLSQTIVTDYRGYNTTYHYDTAGRLAKVESPMVNGSRPTVVYGYDGNDNLTSVTDASGRKVEYQYDNGNRIFEQDSAGNTLERTFNADNQVLTETVYATADPDGLDPTDVGLLGSPSDPQTARYVYANTDPHQLRYVVDAEGRVVEHIYDQNGQRTVTHQYTAARYFLAGLAPEAALTENDLLSWQLGIDLSQRTRTEYAYDLRGQLERQTVFAKVDNTYGIGIADGSESVTQYVYDPHGRLLQTIDPRGSAAGADPSDYTTHYVYDGLGRLIATTDAANHSTLTQYDDANNRVITHLANGLVRNSVYDGAGALISETEVDASLYWQDFQVDASGFTGGALSDPTLMEVKDGRLVLRTQDGVAAWPNIVASGRDHAFGSGVGLRMELTTGSSLTGADFHLGLANTHGGTELSTACLTDCRQQRLRQFPRRQRFRHRGVGADAPARSHSNRYPLRTGSTDPCQRDHPVFLRGGHRPQQRLCG